LNPNAIKMFEYLDQIIGNGLDYIVWSSFAANPNAISLLEQNPNKIVWTWLSCNPNAIHLLEQNQDKINWYHLCLNPNAISLLQKNQDKIVWTWLSRNPSIFEPDYQEMSKERTNIIYQELMEKALHPSRMLQWLNEVEDFE
jgi:hypothetical protein